MECKNWCDLLVSICTVIFSTALGYILGIINSRRREKLSTLKKLLDFLSYYTTIKVNDSNRSDCRTELLEIHNLLLCDFPEGILNRRRKRKLEKRYAKAQKAGIPFTDSKKYESKWIFDKFMFIERNICESLRLGQEFYFTDSMWTDNDKMLKNEFYFKYYKLLHPIYSLFHRKSTISNSNLLF